MAVATTSAAARGGGASKIRYSTGSDLRRLKPAQKVMGYTKFAIHYPNCSFSTRMKVSFAIQALDPRRGEEAEGEENLSALNSHSQDDLEYLGKLVAGSIAAAAVIKYGSIVFPEITRPNIILALIMISTPVIVAILLLIKESSAAGRS